MSTRMQQRRGTASQWLIADPILAEGELGWESDTNKFKFGDGVNNWSTLPYFEDEVSIGGSLEDYVPVALLGEVDGVATLDATGNVPLSQLGNVPAPDFTGYATESYVTTAISNVIDAAPAALDTLNELAAALGDDASFATTVTNALAGKANTSHTHAIGDVTNLQTTLDGKAPLASPTFTGNVHLPSTTTIDGITPTELSYLNGVTSPIQTQLGDKADLEHTHTISDVSGLQTALDTKATETYVNNAVASAQPTFTNHFMLMGA